MTKRYFTIAAAATVAALGLSASARAADPSTNELRQQIDQLQAKVQQLETKQSSTTNLSGKAVDDTVERVLRDADKRSQLLQVEGFSAGYNNGRFMLGSGDGSFTLMPFLQMQFRSSTNIDTTGDDNTENGFSLPRVKLGLDGNAFSKDLTYMFLWNSGDSDGGGSGPLNLEQAWMKWRFADNWAVRAGQFVDPVFHEQLTPSQYQLAADRSLMNTIITGADESFTQGVTLIYTMDKLNLEVGFTDGINTGNSNFRDFPTGAADFGVAGRVEYAILGSAADARDFSAMNTKEDTLVIGAGADWTQSGDTDNILHTVDIQYENANGWSAYGAYVGQYIRNGAGTGITGVTGGAAGSDDDTYNWGFVAQVGYMWNENWEAFGRYDYTHLDDEITVAGGTEDNFNEITAGVNYYFHGHNAKFTVDVSWLPDGAPAGADNLGILSSDDDEFIVRAQFQLML